MYVNQKTKLNNIAVETRKITSLWKIKIENAEVWKKKVLYIYTYSVRESNVDEAVFKQVVVNQKDKL